MKRPAILIICPFFPPNLGGVETHLQALTDYLSQRRYTVNVLTYQPLITKVDRLPFVNKKGGVTVRRFGWFGRGWFDKLTPHSVLQFAYVVPGLLVGSVTWSLWHHNEFEVIHAHGFAAAFVARIIGLLFPQKKMVVSTHFIYRRLDPKSFRAAVFKWVFKAFDNFLLIGNESRKELLQLQLPPEKMKSFSLWLDSNKVVSGSQRNLRLALNLPKKAKLCVLFAGRVIKMKGVFELLKAALEMPREIVFVVAGDGPDLVQLRSMAAGVDNFLVLGRKTQDQLYKYMVASDFVILPSLSDEGQPNVIMEALANGRPVVVTNKGSAKEMIDKSVGVVIEPTAREIRKVVLTFYKDRAKLDKLTKTARPYAIAHFGPKNAKVITNCYRE